eukprot:6453476-Lingulodinium_polyedra.AAC.1
MARPRGGGGSNDAGGRRGAGSRSPSGQQVSAAERMIEAMIQKYSNKFTALASRVDGLVGGGAPRSPDW